MWYYLEFVPGVVAVAAVAMLLFWPFVVTSGDTDEADRREWDENE